MLLLLLLLLLQVLVVKYYLNGTEINLLNVCPIHLKLKLIYFPFAILLFHGGDLVSLITFEGTILYQPVSCFSWKKVPLVIQSVMYLYFKNVRGK